MSFLDFFFLPVYYPTESAYLKATLVMTIPIPVIPGRHRQLQECFCILNNENVRVLQLLIFYNKLGKIQPLEKQMVFRAAGFD